MFEFIVLSYTGVLFLLGAFIPLPYGRFCYNIKDLPLQIPNRISTVFANIFALIALVIQCTLTPPQGTLGSIIFTFLCVHFTWRSIVSQLWIGLSYKDPKETSFLVSLFYASFNMFVGIMFGHMIHNITEPFKLYHLAWLCAASVSLILNAYYDIWCNVNREELGKPTFDKEKGLGKYIRQDVMTEYFHLFFNHGLVAPNYILEIIEWGCFFLLTLYTESFVYFVSVALRLGMRGYWYKVWYYGSSR